MRIDQLRHFLEIAQCHSLSQASENLLIGKSTLSSSIRALEDELRSPLFLRTAKGTFLTSFGENILPFAEEMLASYNKIEAAKDDHSSSVKALHVYSYPAGCVSSMLALCRYMQENFPDINVYVSETKSETLLQKLVASGHHLGINAASSLRYHYIKANAENQNFICEPVYTDSIYVYMHKDHPWAHKEALTLEALAQTPVAISKLFMTSTDNFFYHDFIHLKKRYVTDNYELLKSLVLFGNMPAIAPSFVFYNWNDQHLGQNIVKVPLHANATELIVFLLYKNPLQLNPVETAALTYLRNFYKGAVGK